MFAEVIAVGTELTTGAKLDTNSQWLSLQLADVGVPVIAHTTIADDLEAMTTALKVAAQRASLVIITGGLGPTLDDLTRESLAALAGVPLVEDADSLAAIRNFFLHRGREMPERNVVQALFPEGSIPLPNPRGTAPGIWMRYQSGMKNSCHFAAVPGVPSEMRAMFEAEVLPRVRASLGAIPRVIRRAKIHCFGVGESQCEEMLAGLTARGHVPDVGITVHEATITLRITAMATTADECDSQIARVRTLAAERLGELIFGDEDDELEDVVLRMLHERGESLATVESATGGVLAERLTCSRVSGSAYLGGLVIPKHALPRQTLLPIPDPLLADDGLHRREVAAAMAQACRQRFNSTYALAIAPWPHDNGFTAVGTSGETGPPVSAVALALDGHTISEDVTHFGEVAFMRSRATKVALNLLRRWLGRRASLSER